MSPTTDMASQSETYTALVRGSYYDPFAILGLHRIGNVRVVL